MNLEISVDSIINLASGLLLVALAVFVLRARPRTRNSTRFGWFAALFGLRFVFVNLDEMLTKTPLFVPALLGIAAGVSFIASAVFLWAFSIGFPSAIPQKDRRSLLLAPILLSAGFFIYWNIDLDYFSLREALANGVPFETVIGLVVMVIGYTAMIATLWGVILLYAQRYRTTSNLGERRQYALVAAALVIWPAFENAFHGPGRATDGLVVYWVGTGVLVLLAAVWLANVNPPGSRTARSVALITLGAGFAGAVYSLLLTSGPLGEGGLGLSRVVGVAILTYAILRHQVLGLDVKVRWTISKTTLAGIFVAVFFIVSEAAQEFFGETFGGPYIGIIAAGLLVFAIAPLSRFADRLAAKAVPLSTIDADVKDGPQKPEDLFRIALRPSLRDHILTRDEEIDLHRLAAGLGIDPTRAHELLAETEREADDTKRRNV